ncbi:MAG: TolC family outer membrane protein [Chlorobiaceae bacterium]|nr:TolC family outer membrane protein [Chlorobiaceae bacterium]
MTVFRWFIPAAILLAPRALPAEEPLSLTGAYAYAVHSDARIRSAEADHSISREEVSKAVSAFMPTIRASASRGRNRTESVIPSAYQDQYYNTISNSLTLKQPLFNLQNVSSLKQAKAIDAKSECMLAHEHSLLIVRTAEAFFNVLFAEESLAFSRSQTTAALGQLQQVKKRYTGGFGTLTEVNEAQANYDVAIAEEATGVSNLDASRHELERITGIYAEKLYHLAPEKLVLNKPDPERVEEWILLAKENNLQVNASRKEIEVADREIDKNRASRYPQVDLWAGKSYSQSENNYTIGSTYNTYSVTVQLNVPIYSGGYTSASIRQSVARKLKAYDDMELQERSATSDIRKYYHSQLNSIVQIKAYEQALRSNGIALEGTRKAFLAGFRTNADVLDAQKKLFDSRRNLAKARYQYILSGLMLKDTAGLLRVADLEALNSCLAAPGS